jgi:hypothetical protein
MNQRESKMAEKEPELTVQDAISVRFGDVVITISAIEGGVLTGKTNDQIIKYCADLLLQTTDASTLENFLDTSLSIEETLKEDFGMNALDVSVFMANWRKRLYLKTIGEQNPVVEEVRPTRPVEPSSDAEAPTETVLAVKDGTVTVEKVPSRPSNFRQADIASINIPLADKKILSEDSQVPTNFTVTEK